MDRYGNALSMTTTIESSFGNGVMVRGFLLNNELTDFAFSPTDNQGNLVANRVEPNKRPRSSMSPTIVFDADGRVALVTGSPGGSRIIGYTAQSIVNVIDFGLDPQEAINVPHYMNRNGRTDIEEPIPGVTLEYDAQALADALISKGHSVGIIEQNSGLSMIQVKEHEHPGPGNRKHRGKDKRSQRLLIGGADYRRDGTVGVARPGGYAVAPLFDGLKQHRWCTLCHRCRFRPVPPHTYLQTVASGTCLPTADPFPTAQTPPVFR